MRVLFVVQGEGRGHLTQAISLYRQLERTSHEVVGVLVGKSPQREIPSFFIDQIDAPIDRFESLNFVPSAKNTRVQISTTLWRNLQRSPSYWASMRFIAKTIEERQVDLVVNFYELLVGLTYLTFRPNAPMVCIGHQYLFLHRDFAFPRGKYASRLLLRQYTRLTALGASKMIALSFRQMPGDRNRRISVCPPLLREELFEQQVGQDNYILGYMLNSGFSEEVKAWSERNPDQPLEFFWDRKEEDRPNSALTLRPLNDQRFLSMMARAHGYVTTAGFESVCEAMYLGKPILMVPAHFEQECNAHDAMRSGAGVKSDRFDIGQLLELAQFFRPNQTFQHWVRSAGDSVLREVCSFKKSV